MTDILNLFERGVGGVDVLKVIDIRRRLLTARDGYLAALWELSQAVRRSSSGGRRPGSRSRTRGNTAPNRLSNSRVSNPTSFKTFETVPA